MVNRPLGLLFALMCFVLRAQTFQIVYPFSDVTASSGTVSSPPVQQVTGLTAGSFSAFGVSANPNASGRFSFTGWPPGAANGNDDFSSFTGALSPFSYYETEIMVLPGYTLSLTDMSFAMRRSGTGVRNYCVRTNADSFTENLVASTGSNTKLTVLPGEIFFWLHDDASTTSDQKGSVVSFNPSHQQLTGVVRIRFYAWNAEAGSGSFSIDDVMIRGTLADSAQVNGLNEVFPGRNCVDQISVEHDMEFCGWRLASVYDIAGHELGIDRFLMQWKERSISEGVYLLVWKSGGSLITRKIRVH